ncbi:hypothetical protein M430DRAFT_272996 [Amorphotheca resinae ATCC 22711]|uniref:Uncharacterized protein n=1 Tax=Amorphotheca resinae ATCC 22711 TaxID=857342 RepID=A0A2T3BBI6_AMORE|nr:hypothetical protein M430DRAFT_272996 [Amorphotheca resinae ATCC 22711]PSS25634.1 hypothetical protein M430DRAFT_272996 [Amorphotheca resinae ATCC 22711]
MSRMASAPPKHHRAAAPLRRCLGPTSAPLFFQITLAVSSPSCGMVGRPPVTIPPRYSFSARLAECSAHPWAKPSTIITTPPADNLLLINTSVSCYGLTEAATKRTRGGHGPRQAVNRVLPYVFSHTCTNPSMERIIAQQQRDGCIMHGHTRTAKTKGKSSLLLSRDP